MIDYKAKLKKIRITKYGFAANIKQLHKLFL